MCGVLPRSRSLGVIANVCVNASFRDNYKGGIFVGESTKEAQMVCTPDPVRRRSFADVLLETSTQMALSRPGLAIAAESFRAIIRIM